MLTSTQGYSEDFSTIILKNIYIHMKMQKTTTSTCTHSQPYIKKEDKGKHLWRRETKSVFFVSINAEIEFLKILTLKFFKSSTFIDLKQHLCVLKRPKHRTKQAYFAKYLYADRGWVSQWSCDNLWAPFCQCWPWSSHSCDQLWPKHNHRCWNYNVHIRPKNKHHVKLFIQA